ncbi:MAG: TRAP transporter fused permease subunit [Proteobacteria bacterium]|nr:TRAP transporter fused permease subunit [Pseudomonadota bacterium]MDA1022598.1 TRAP transporter fused permease subunit [Pseudomonadota bacterium]
MPSWKKLRTAFDIPFLVIGIALTVYIGFAAFGFLKNSSEHYSNFILGTCLMTGLLAVRKLCDEKIQGDVQRFFGIRFTFAAFALVTSAIAMGYVRYNAVTLEQTQPFFNDTDMIFGWLMTISILALTLIHWGLLLTSVIAVAIAYFFLGHMIENPLFMTPQYDPKFVMNYIGLGTNQGFYYLAQVAADSVYFLIIYAAILLGVGMLDMVLDVGKMTGRRVSGGAAGPAIIGSGVVASIMGQAVSNVVLTGRLTIPMMKKYGYRNSMAGAIEATASTAGQIMPPVMGLAAFIIASFLNLPYIDVALSGLVPGLLYLTGVSIAVAVYARRYNLPKLKEKVDTTRIKRLLPTFIISFGVVLWFLLGYRSPAIAGLWGIILALGLCMFQGKYRPTRRQLYEAVEEGFYLVSILSLLLIAIGPLGQVMLTTNLAGRLGSVLIQYLPDTQLILLIGAMVVSLILGMGLPTPVAYIIVALALVPFMQQIGLPPLQAHFFVFYFAVFSTLTPPVAVSVLAAAKLADASFLNTAADSLKIALTTFIIPFAFVFFPELMTFPHLTWAVVPAILVVLAFQWTVSISTYGYLFRPLIAWERGVFAVAALGGFMGMAYSNTTYYTVHAVLFVGMAVMLFATRKRNVLETEAAE